MRNYDDGGWPEVIAEYMSEFQTYRREHEKLTAEIRRLQRALMEKAQAYARNGQAEAAIQTLNLVMKR